MKISVFSAFLSLFFTFSLLLSASACKVKEGCPSMNQHTIVGKDGKLPVKPGKSGLFPQAAKRR